MMLSILATANMAYDFIVQNDGKGFIEVNQCMIEIQEMDYTRERCVSKKFPNQRLQINHRTFAHNGAVYTIPENMLEAFYKLIQK